MYKIIIIIMLSIFSTTIISNSKVDRIIDKILEKKYLMLSKRLLFPKKEGKKIVKTLKKYDSQIMKLRIEMMSKGKELKKGVKDKDHFKKVLKFERKVLKQHYKILTIQKEKIEALEKTGLSDENVVKIIHLERRFIKRLMNKISNWKR